VQRSIGDVHHLVQLNSLSCSQPMETGENVCDVVWVTYRLATDQDSGCRVQNYDCQVVKEKFPSMEFRPLSSPPPFPPFPSFSPGRVRPCQAVAPLPLFLSLPLFLPSLISIPSPIICPSPSHSNPFPPLFRGSRYNPRKNVRNCRCSYVSFSAVGTEKQQFNTRGFIPVKCKIY
jgi:hypothetical protein